MTGTEADIQQDMRVKLGARHETVIKARCCLYGSYASVLFDDEKLPEFVLRAELERSEAGRRQKVKKEMNDGNG